MVQKRKPSGGGLYKTKPGKRKPGATARRAPSRALKPKPKRKPAGSATRKPAAAASSRRGHALGGAFGNSGKIGGMMRSLAARTLAKRRARKKQ